MLHYKFTLQVHKRFWISIAWMMHHMPSQSLRLLTVVRGGVATACVCFFFFGIFFLLGVFFFLGVFFLAGFFLGVFFFFFGGPEVPSSSGCHFLHHRTGMNQFESYTSHNKFTMQYHSYFLCNIPLGWCFWSNIFCWFCKLQVLAKCP